MVIKNKKMKVKSICCIGAGYVGGPTMAVIALKCPEIKVTVVDHNQKKIDLWNDSDLSKIPVFEPGLAEIIEKTRNKNLFFSVNIDQAIEDSEMIFMAVNTPTKTSGLGAGMASDLKYVEKCAKNIRDAASSKKIVIEKSTLPVRTAEKIKEILNQNSKGIDFEVLSNPEFLAEGTAINDLYKSDRVIIGGDNSKSGKEATTLLKNIYKKWIPEEKILTLNIWSAELSKLASNAMLAQRISSINSLSFLCEKTGANINEVSKAIGMDHRIGNKFLNPSPGFGGSCFQKDILNLVYLFKYYGLDDIAEYWHQVVKMNNYQRLRIANKIKDFISEKKLEKKVIILGWAFKKDTNDSRESSSIYVSFELLKMGYEIYVYDPKVNNTRILNDLKQLKQDLNNSEVNIDKNIKVLNTLKSAFKHEYPIVILTEWDEFKEINYLNTKLKIFDFRNIINREKTIFSL